ncbi:MBG domain-containing protein [uncultured Slackia sp.]|uniref:MBG domain-containing protein n=1 Tax=uncultured Slackia sp. TaxID=665903 RepID=UPI0026DA941B|nr:MBG domain-containing protein [uncultured Slackia sp.]
MNPVTDKVTVTIKGKQDTKPYNGSTQFVTGYEFSTNNSLYAQTNVKFTGDATAKGIAVGNYNMNLAKEQFSNTNENFSNVEFVVEDGWLKIEGGEIDQDGVVWNTHDNQKVYDGTPLAAYAATATDKHGNALNVEYGIDGKTWTSDPSQITITHFGYQPVLLRATGSNYAEGQYAVSYESIAITKRLVTLTSEGGNKPYDGTPLTNGTVTATAKGEGVGFIDGEGVSFDVTGSQTEKGESDNTFTYTFNEGTSEADYWVTTKPGKLIVTADENEVVVTITENGGNVEYDGTEKSVSGYEFSASNELYKKSDFTFSGNDTVKGTNVGTYDMELKPSDFTNNNQNFSKVTFVIVDGQLEITPKDIKTGENMSVEALADVVYNGQPQLLKPVVKDGEKTLVEGTDYTLSYEGDTTNVGTVKVVVTGIGNYAGTTDVTYKITQRSVTLTSVTDSKPYDGTALTRPNVTATGDGFVDGEVTNVRATGSVTTVAEGEVVNTIVYDEGVNFKAGNYDITKKEGKLSITALSAEDGLAITPNNAEYTYNAESHSAGSASASASVAGTNVSLEYRVEGSPDTEWRSNVSEITAINAGTVTIEVRASADNYSGYKHAKQTLTINKRDVELTSASATKVYDGTALTKDWVDMGPNRADTGFIWTDLADDGQVHATGSQTVVGKSENTISYKLKDGAASNYNIIGEHLGTLEVTEQSIVPDPKNPESYTGVTISNPSDSVYNGEEHKWAPEVKDAKGNALVEGTDYAVSYDTDNFIDAKTITVTITGKGNYTGTATKTYKITPAPLTVNANSDSRVYDGTPLTAGGTIEGLVGDETATAKTEGSQTEVGSSANKVVGIEWGTAEDGNYYIQSQNDGTLTVTAKSIATSGMTVGDLFDVVYSGTEQAQKPEVKDGDTALVEGTDYDLDFSEDKTNVGTVTVVVTGKGNYAGEVTRTYQIVPAKLTVTTPSASKVYNGKALTAEGTISGFVNGETAAFNTTGSQTEVGSSTNTYAINWTGAAKQGNYTISENLGTLTVTETTDEIIVTPSNYNGIYDGQTHGVDVTVTGLPEGYSVKTAASYATATDVTDGVIANVDELVIANAQGEDVTANLKITKGTGTIKITPATLKVTTYGAKAEYNGNALTADGEVTGFVNNEAAAFTTTGSQTEVGSSTNTYAIDWSDTAKQSNYTVEEHLGTLEVTKNMAAIMVIPQGGSKPYDGTALTSAGVTTYGLPAGYTLAATTKGSVTNVGGATAEVDTYSIKDATGEDVTDQFGNVFTGKATLQVTKRPVTVASASASKVYDGIALTKHEASVTDGSLATGESFSYDFSGEQTTVGSTSNAYAIKAGANTDLDNYEITKANGTLTVTAQSINPTDPTPGAYTGVEVDSPSDVTYDANEHKWVPTVIDKDKNKLVEGTDYEVTYSTDDFTNVTGSIKVTIVGKGNYTGTVTRTYQITPASVALRSNSHEFTYTGEPQGDAAVNVSGAAELFQSQVNDLKATGSVTNVGDVAENSISYNWNDGFTADNYSIETSFGELSVVAKNIDTGKDMSVNDPVNVTYNGGDQTWAPTVNDGEKTLVGGSDYTVSYSTDDRTNVTGVITVTIMGKGNYTGAIEKNYQVLPKGYSVTTATGSKVYDGKPLKGSELEGNAVDGLVDGSDATFTVTGSQTEVGGDAKNNTYKLTFSSEQMAKNYTLASEQLGTLTVTENADEIVVTTTGGTFAYDGQAHGATVSVSELPEGYTLEKAESSASATNVADGTVAATADTLVIRNAQGKDVTNELKIRKIDGEIQITPAPLNIETGSAKKTYDGSALTNATLKVDGLVAGDVVTGRTTGSQTEVGSSANTYTLTWGEVDPANYEITEQLGVLTVEAVVAPVIPGPQQSGGPVVVPPTTTEPAGPADVVADALEGAYETVTGDKATEEQIYDSENPLGKEQAAHCWVHWYMILVMILTVLYGVAVWLRRGNHTRKLKSDMNNILGGGDDGKDPSGSPVAANHPAGMEA